MRYAGKSSRNSRSFRGVFRAGFHQIVTASSTCRRPNNLPLLASDGVESDLASLEDSPETVDHSECLCLGPSLKPKLVKSFPITHPIPQTPPRNMISLHLSVCHFSYHAPQTETPLERSPSAPVPVVGLENVARECVKNLVPRLIVVSQAACTESDDEICASKLAGEDAVREIYAKANIPGVTYTIARAGMWALRALCTWVGDDDDDDDDDLHCQSRYVGSEDVHFAHGNIS